MELSPAPLEADYESDLPWSVHYSALMEFHARNGHCNVPPETIFECDLPGLGLGGSSLHYSANLGRWLYTQRLRKLGRDVKLSGECEVLLNGLVNTGKLTWEIGAIGSSSSSSLDRPSTGDALSSELNWTSHYAALLEYCKEHGHCIYL